MTDASIDRDSSYQLGVAKFIIGSCNKFRLIFDLKINIIWFRGFALFIVVGDGDDGGWVKVLFKQSN